MVPFRFAVQLNKADSAPAWRARSRQVEALGYSTLFIPDHFDDQYGPLVALTVAGEHHTVTDALGTPPPHQRPHPPMIIGGGGKRVLAFAGQEADIVGINPNLAAGYVGPEVAATSLVESYRQRVEWVRAAAGDRFDQLELQILTFFVQVVPNAAEVLEQMAPMFQASPQAVAEIPMALVGTVDQITETPQRRREEMGFSYIVVHQAELEAFAPVVARLAGT